MVAARVGRNPLGTHAAAAVNRIVRVDENIEFARRRNANPVIRTHNRREVNDTDNVATVTVATNPAEHAAVAVAIVDPLEAALFEVHFI